jgi:hypothetical protein
LTGRFRPWDQTSTRRRSGRVIRPLPAAAHPMPGHARTAARAARLRGRPGSLGAELELFLVHEATRPLPRNQAVLAAVGDARVSLELDRFNLELNATRTLLAGHPFTVLGEELRLLLGRVGDAARGARGPGRARQRPAHAAPCRPAPQGDQRPAALPGAGPRPAPAAPRPAPHSHRGSRPVGAGQRRRRRGGRQHLLPGAPKGRRSRPPRRCWRWPATRHLRWPPAVGGDPDRAVQAVHRRPRRPRATPPARPDGVWHRLAAGWAAGTVR